MTTAAIAQPAAQSSDGLFNFRTIARAFRSGLIVALVLGGLAVILQVFLRPLIASTSVEENVTAVLGDALISLLPVFAYLACGSSARAAAPRRLLRAVIAAVIATSVLYVGITAVESVLKLGAFQPRQSLQITLSQIDEGVLVEAVEAGGAADQAGILPGDVITAIRRDPITLDTLQKTIATSQVGDPLRFQIQRNGEEQLITARVGKGTSVQTSALINNYGIALIAACFAIFFPRSWVAYVLLLLSLAPLIIGYLWLLIATFSVRTHGLLPLDAQDNVGGLTLTNWRFLVDPLSKGQSVWTITLNTLIVAVVMTVLVVLVASMAGYALSRMNFFGRRMFLSFTLILHGFPAVTLLIAIFFVLNFLGKIPIIGDIFGYNKLGGIALVMVAFELPLGIWLMKGFFDGVSWDMERSALIDGATRWRAFWEIILPQIRPGILALGIFAFISGWNAYLIPQTFSIGTNTATLSVFLRQFIGDTAPTDWNQVAAVGIFQLIPVLLLFVFAQEYLLNIYAGGLKGSS